MLFHQSHLKKTSNKKVFNIHIQDPKVNLNHFDFIVAPEHDGIKVKMLLQQRCNSLSYRK